MTQTKTPLKSTLGHSSRLSNVVPRNKGKVFVNSKLPNQKHESMESFIDKALHHAAILMHTTGTGLCYAM